MCNDSASAWVRAKIRNKLLSNTIERTERPSTKVYKGIRIALTIAIVMYLLWRMYANRSALASLAPQGNLLSFVGALVACMAAYQCLLSGWLILLQRTGCYKPGKLGVYARIWWISHLYRYIPGKVLVIVERVRMGAQVGIPISTGVALTLIESLMSILAGSAISVLAIAYYAEFDRGMLSLISVFIVGTVFVFPWMLRFFCRLPLVNSKYPELRSIELRTQDVLVIVVPYFLYYLLLGLSFFLITRNLQLFDWPDLVGLCGIYALSHVISLIALFAPAGLGVREGAFAVQLGRFVPAGVAEMLAIGARVWFTLVELFCYCLVMVFCSALPAQSEKTDAG